MAAKAAHRLRQDFHQVVTRKEYALFEAHRSARIRFLRSTSNTSRLSVGFPALKPRPTIFDLLL
jgi:hypothetical protein